MQLYNNIINIKNYFIKRIRSVIVIHYLLYKKKRTRTIIADILYENQFACRSSKDVRFKNYDLYKINCL